MDALSKQVGGDHYKKGIQPFQLSFANGHDGCTHAIQKYLTRYLRVDPDVGYMALQKAHHITAIRAACLAEFDTDYPPTNRLPIRDYIESNDLEIHTANVVQLVEAWFENTGVDDDTYVTAIRSHIRTLARHHFPLRYQLEDFEA